MTNDRLKAWLKTKPAEAEYSYFNEPRCVLSEYIYEHDIKGFAGSRAIYLTRTLDEFLAVDVALRGQGRAEEVPLPEGWDIIAREKPRTYGAMLKRLNTLDAAGKAS